MQLFPKIGMGRKEDCVKSKGLLLLFFLSFRAVKLFCIIL